MITFWGGKYQYSLCFQVTKLFFLFLTMEKSMTMAKWLAMTGLEPAQYATGLEPAMFRSEV